MQNLSGLVWRMGWLAGALAAAATAQTPTLSLELTEINAIPICGGGTSRMTVAPRDVLTAVVFLRDWSPNGEPLRGYQAELDHGTFTSGTAGSVKPLGYQTTTLSGLQNPNSAFIDLTDPKFVHKGEQAIAFADSDHVTPGYRWISALFTEEGPVSRQDGIKFYCGTLRLLVSEDAEGTFTIGLVSGIDSSTLRTPRGNSIEPVDLEPLTLVVTPGDRPPWISSSTPQDGSIDARELKLARGSRTGGWDEIELAFSTEPIPQSAGDFTIEDGTAAPPRIKSVETSGKRAKLMLDRPITCGAWTTITHTTSGTKTRLGRFPGDVTNDGVADSRDLPVLINGLNGVAPLALHRTDLDGNGAPGASDVLWLVSLLNKG